jgi:hypothetical protein
MAATPVVLCPLEAEGRAVRAALDRAGLGRIPVRLTGVGAAAAEAAIDALDPRTPLVVMAGIGGGLAEGPPVVVARRVVDERGGRWESPSRVDRDAAAGRHGTPGAGSTAGEGVTVLGVDRIISTPAEKRRLYEQTGAVVVDMESHGLARACARRPGLPWAVVRGVSDAHDEAIPEQLVRWFDPRGRLILRRLAGDLAVRPWLTPSLVRLGRRSRRVLPLVGERVTALVRAFLAAGDAQADADAASVGAT